MVGLPFTPLLFEVWVWVICFEPLFIVHSCSSYPIPITAIVSSPSHRHLLNLPLSSGQKIGRLIFSFYVFHTCRPVDPVLLPFHTCSQSFILFPLKFISAYFSVFLLPNLIYISELTLQIYISELTLLIYISELLFFLHAFPVEGFGNLGGVEYCLSSDSRFGFRFICVQFMPVSGYCVMFSSGTTNFDPHNYRVFFLLVRYCFLVG